MGSAEVKRQSIRGGNGRNYTPAEMPRHELTAQDASNGAKARNAKAAARTLEQRQRAAVVWEIVTELDDIHPAALEAALRGLTRGAEALESVPIDDALDAKRVLEAAEIAHRISRLASGQSTSNVAHAQLSSEERAERLAQLDAMRNAPTREEPPAETGGTREVGAS